MLSELKTVSWNGEAIANLEFFGNSDLTYRNRHYIYDEYKNDFPDYCAAEIRCTRAEVKRIILFEKNIIVCLLFSRILFITSFIIDSISYFI